MTDANTLFGPHGGQGCPTNRPLALPADLSAAIAEADAFADEVIAAGFCDPADRPSREASDIAAKVLLRLLRHAQSVPGGSSFGGLVHAGGLSEEIDRLLPRPPSDQLPLDIGLPDTPPMYVVEPYEVDADRHGLYARPGVATYRALRGGIHQTTGERELLIEWAWKDFAERDPVWAAKLESMRGDHG